jgi:hypothetical protein
MLRERKEHEQIVASRADNHQRELERHEEEMKEQLAEREKREKSQKEGELEEQLRQRQETYEQVRAPITHRTRSRKTH